MTSRVPSSLSTSFRWLLFLPLALIMAACSGEPNLGDAEAVAEYLCEESNAITESTVENGIDDEALNNYVQDMRAFEAKLRAYHGDTFADWNSRMEAHFLEICRLEEPTLPN